jgi:hypothetical protein
MSATDAKAQDEARILRVVDSHPEVHATRIEQLVEPVLQRWRIQPP